MITDALLGFFFGLLEHIIKWIPESQMPDLDIQHTAFGEAYSWFATANYYFPLVEMFKFIVASSSAFPAYAMFKFIRGAV